MTLAPCRCGSTDLYMHTWRMGSGANVWCAKCSAGTPAGALADAVALVVNVRGDEDARDLARERWNRWAS